MWIHLFKVICGLLLTIEIMNESFSDVSVEPGMGLVFSPSLGRGQGRRVRVDTNNTFKGDTRRKLQRGLAPVCLVTSILHCTDIVRNTFYIHLTLSRPLLIYSHSLAYAAMGRVLSNRGHTYAVKSVLDVFSEHRAAQFGRNTKVCVRSKHESLAWCARGRISNIPWLLLGNAQNIHTGPARSADMNRMEPIFGFCAVTGDPKLREAAFWKYNMIGMEDGLLGAGWHTCECPHCHPGCVNTSPWNLISSHTRPCCESPERAWANPWTSGNPTQPNNFPAMLWWETFDQSDRKTLPGKDKIKTRGKAKKPSPRCETMLSCRADRENKG